MFLCLLDELILGFCYSDLQWKTGGFEIASTITLVLQVDRLNPSLIHPLSLTRLVRLSRVTYYLLCSACVTYGTLYHVIAHQVLLTQPLPREALGSLELTILVIPLYFVRRIFYPVARKTFK